MNTHFAPMTMGKRRSAYRMRGDSMAPRVRSRDLLLIDTTDTAPADGGLFLVWLDAWGDYAVRTIETVPGGLLLRCEDPVYTPEVFAREEVEIAGRVCGLWRDDGL